MRRLGTLGLLAVLVALASGCDVYGEDVARGDVATRPVRVAATTNFIADTVRAVGGDRTVVTGLMGPGVDPHLYKASAQDVRTLRQADLVLYGGLELEGKMQDLFEQLDDHQPAKAITDAIPRSRLLDPGEGAPANEEYDPHVWFDVALWRYVVVGIRDALIAVDPAHARVYRDNAARYDAELAALDREIRAELATIPAQRRVLVTSHDAFTYFGRAYDLDVAAIQGVSTASEATTADIRRVAELIARRGVRSVFVESSVPRQTIDAVAAASARLGRPVRVGEELYADAAGDAGSVEGTYIGMLRANVRRITEGLR